MATITLDNLKKQTLLKTPPSYEDSIIATGNNIMNSALSSITENQRLADEANKANQDLLKSKNSKDAQLLGKTAFSQEQQVLAGVGTEKANLDRFSEDLNSINANISGLNRESQAIPLQIQEQFKNTNATDGGVAPIQAGRLRENAIKALTQASLGDIAVANIKNSKIRYDSALEKANQAVDLKYEPIEKEIAQIIQQLAMNKEYILDPAEKKLVASQEKILNERQRINTERKAEEKSLNDLKIEVAKMGGNPSSLDKAKSFKEAINIASSTLKNSQNEIVRLENGETLIVNKLTGQRIKSLGGAKPTTAGLKNGFVITPDVVASNNGDIVSVLAGIIDKSGAKKDDTLTSVMGVLSGLTGLVKRNPDKKFDGVNPFSFLTPNRFTSTEGRTNRGNFSAIKLQTEKWASGASLTVQQTKEVVKLIPTTFDTDTQVVDKINGLANYMVTQARGNLATQGIDAQFQSLDMWGGVNTDPLGLFGDDPLGLMNVDKTSSSLFKNLSNNILGFNI